VFCSLCAFLLLGTASPVKLLPKACIVRMPLCSVLHQVLICIKQVLPSMLPVLLSFYILCVYIIIEFGFFTSSGTRYENIFLPVVGDTSGEVFMCSPRIICTLPIVFSANFACFLQAVTRWRKHLKPVTLLACAQAFVLRTKWRFVIP